jgi:hypothetical protein
MKAVQTNKSRLFLNPSNPFLDKKKIRTHNVKQILHVTSPGFRRLKSLFGTGTANYRKIQSPVKAKFHLITVQQKPRGGVEV